MASYGSTVAVASTGGQRAAAIAALIRVPVARGLFDRMWRENDVRLATERSHEGPNPHFIVASLESAGPALQRLLFGAGHFTPIISGTLTV